MKTSAAGRALIEQREGRRLTAYRDTKGVWTIGVGHTGRMSPPRVTPGLTITESACDAYLAADLAPVEAVIADAVKVPISQNEYDALASLGFNIGPAALRPSTVVRKLNLGDIAGAADAFLLWNRPAGLEGRRVGEKAQFVTPDAPGAVDVAKVRAETLGARAEAAMARANTTKRAGGALAIGGAAAAAASAHTHHAHAAMWIVGLVLVGATIDGVVAWFHSRLATTLATNATTQSRTSSAPAHA